ncbi:MAG: flotillin [Planctomycetes bacterium]|nr:flotillin [Planctomycetota bacterium]
MYTFLIVLAVLIGIVAGILALCYKKVGPNEVLIISGGKRQTVTDPDGQVRTIGYRLHIGGGTFLTPLVERAQVISIEMLTVNIQTPEVYTAKGVPLMVEATAQLKIATDDFSLRMAAEQFLGKGGDGIKKIANEIIDGCIRSSLGTMDVEEIYQNQKGFAQQVIETVSPDFKNMGLILLSFALTGIKDTQGYLEAMGRPKIAQVKRDAIIAEAEADKEAAMKEAGAKKEKEIARLKGETEIAEAHRDFETQKATFEVVINQNRAKADMAYELQRHQLNQEVKKEEYKVKIVEKQQAILLGEHEAARMDKELEANVKKPAEAQKYEAKLKAEADAYRMQKEAEARAEAAKIEGAVEAEHVRLMGEAEAEAMLKKAESWERYTQAAMFEMFMEKLPSLAEAIAQPLSKVDKITVVNSGGDDSSLGVSKVTGEVAKILAQMPEVIESLSGVDVKALLRKLPQGSAREGTEKGGPEETAKHASSRSNPKGSKPKHRGK